MHLGKYACSGPAYERYQQALDCGGFGWEQLEREHLRLPSNTNILFFGHSYLGQIFLSFLCATELVSKAEDGVGERFWNEALNITVIMLQNEKMLQHSDAVISSRALRDFLATMRFDLIVYMSPHPDCFFTYHEVKAAGWANYSQYACVDLGHSVERATYAKLEASTPALVPKVVSTHARDRAQWKLMREHARLGAAKVLQWNDEAKPEALFAEPQSQMEDDHVVIDATRWVRWKPCDVPACGTLGNGHQCLPSVLSFVARGLLRGIRSAYMSR